MAYGIAPLQTNLGKFVYIYNMVIYMGLNGPKILNRDTIYFL